MKIKQDYLANGLPLVHVPIQGPVVHLSLMINAGSRFEDESERGVAHFLEHMMFKGTKRRKAYHILSRLDDVGGELNAYTTKEEICIHASFLKPYFSRALELISDILLHSQFPLKEIEKEKEVVLDEIASYEDAPGDLIFEDFESLLFQQHPLAHTILGEPKDVRKISFDSIKNYWNKHFVASNMSLALVGDLSYNRVLKGLNQHFGPIPQGTKPLFTKEHIQYRASQKEVQKDTNQAHCLIGAPAYAAKDENLAAFSLLNNLLGGAGMNNRLSLNIREKYGFTYHLESYYQPFTDTGVFGVYLGTDAKSISKSKQLVFKELKKLREKELGTLQLHKAKTQLTGQLAMNRENNLARSQAFAKSLLLEEPLKTFDQIAAEIEAIKGTDILRVANEVFAQEKISELTYLAK